MVEFFYSSCDLCVSILCRTYFVFLYIFYYLVHRERYKLRLKVGHMSHIGHILVTQITQIKISLSYWNGYLLSDRVWWNISLCHPFQYLVITNGIGVNCAFRNLFRTSTWTSVPFLCHPVWTYPIAMFFPNVGEGIPEVTTPIWEVPAVLKIFAPSERGLRMLSMKMREKTQRTSSRHTVYYQTYASFWWSRC